MPKRLAEAPFGDCARVPALGCLSPPAPHAAPALWWRCLAVATLELLVPTEVAPPPALRRCKEAWACGARLKAGCCTLRDLRWTSSSAATGFSCKRSTCAVPPPLRWTATRLPLQLLALQGRLGSPLQRSSAASSASLHCDATAELELKAAASSMACMNSSLSGKFDSKKTAVQGMRYSEPRVPELNFLWGTAQATAWAPPSAHEARSMTAASAASLMPEDPAEASGKKMGRHCPLGGVRDGVTGKDGAVDKAGDPICDPQLASDPAAQPPGPREGGRLAGRGATAASTGRGARTGAGDGVGATHEAVSAEPPPTGPPAVHRHLAL